MISKYLLTIIVFILYLPIYAQYNSFSISVNSDEIGMCNFEFYKYSTRSADLQIFTWDGTTLTPYPIPNQVRTYRGTITNHLNYKAFAVWYPGDTIFIKVLKGKGEKDGGFLIKNIAVQDYKITELNLPTVNAPQKSNWMLTSGYSCTYLDLMNIDKANGDYETLIAMWENGVNSMDYFATRDLGLSFTTNLLIIPTNPNIIKESDIIKPAHYSNQITPISTFWKTTGSGGGAGRHMFCINPFKGGSTSFSRSDLGAMPHEVGHVLDLGHYHNQKDAQNGNQFYYGRNSVAIATGHLNLPNNACIINTNPNYTDPVHPRVQEDYVITNKNEFIDIDVLSNDTDFNFDAISIKNFDATSVNGGSIIKQGNMLRYTPPNDFLGRDYFYYTAESGQGNGYFTNYAKVLVEVRDDSCDRALRYTFEETSGNIVHDSGWTIASQNATLYNADFSTHSTTGIVGNAIDLSSDTVGVVLNDILDPLDRDLSVSVWFKLNVVPKGRAFVFDSGAMGNLGNEGLSISINTDGIYFHAQTEALDKAGAELLDNTPLIVNKWYHSVMIIDRNTNTLRAFVDGIEVTNSPTSNIDFNPEHIIKGYPGYMHPTNPNKSRRATTLGMRSNSKIRNVVGTLNGAIDEFRIFTKALSSSEVSMLYNSPGDLTVQCNTSSENYNSIEDDRVIIYPNPTTGIFRFDVQCVKSISVYTTTGEIMLRKNIYQENKNAAIDLRFLSKGVYLVRISLDDSDTQVFKKIILY